MTWLNRLKTRHLKCLGFECFQCLSSFCLVTLRKEGVHEADHHFFLCVHFQAKWEAVKIDLSNKIYSHNILFYLASATYHARYEMPIIRLTCLILRCPIIVHFFGPLFKWHLNNDKIICHPDAS